MKKLIGVFMILGLILSHQSCMQEGANSNPENLVAPTLPETSSFLIPTQEFGFVENGKESSTRNDKSNWIHAGANILVWNTVVFVQTTTPIAAFGNAFNYKAKYIGDSSFEWKYQYDHQADGTTYDVSLVGQYISNQTEVAWTMYLNVAGNADRFTWFEGVAQTKKKAGVFTFFKDAGAHKPYMEISYSNDPTEGEASIRFSNVLSGDTENGNYIEWQKHTSETFDRSYDVMTNGNRLEMEGNETTKDGRVKDPNHFNDSVWHCWNEVKNNIDC